MTYVCGITYDLLMGLTGLAGIVLDSFVCTEQVLNVKGGSLVARVQVHDNESIESAIRRFKRAVAREGIITDTKKHAFYLKPGERRRLKSQVARRRARKSLRKRQQED